MSGISFLRRGGDGGGWRAYFNTELERLQRELPDHDDKISPQRPTHHVVFVAQEFIKSVKRNDLPRPLVVAGTDGSLQIRWRRSRELSIFINPQTVQFLQVFPHGEMKEGELHTVADLPPLIDWLLAA